MTERWLVTGAGGMLGRDLVELLRKQGVAVTAAGRAELDITDTARVREVVDGHQVVVNTAAWTDVDGAESAEMRARAVNAEAPADLARACVAADARLVHISTDYVFRGAADTPYAERTPTDPVNAYGRTKRDGEEAVREIAPSRSIVVRTSWLYGRHGKNFVSTIARLEREREHIDVVDDQRGQPTWTRDVAERIVALVGADVDGGIWHATNSGSTTWWGLARAVFEQLGADPDRVRPVTSDAFPRRARRPAYSVLGDAMGTAHGVQPMRPWRAALTEASPVVLHHRA